MTKHLYKTGRLGESFVALVSYNESTDTYLVRKAFTNVLFTVSASEITDFCL